MGGERKRERERKKWPKGLLRDRLVERESGGGWLEIDWERRRVWRDS